MEAHRILLIAPYTSMANRALKVSETREDVILTVEVGNLAEGAEIVKELEGTFDAILSRGGTKLLIEEVTNLPVFAIPVSYVDILNHLKLVEAFDEKFAIVAYPEIAEVIHQICQILKYDYEIHEIHSSEECKVIISNLKGLGYELILGDTISVQYAEEMGLNGMLISSGQESIDIALDQVTEYLRNINRLNETIQNQKNLLSFYGNHQFIFDPRGQLIYPEAADPVLADLCRNIIPSLTGNKGYKTQRKSRGEIFRIKGKRMDLGGTRYYFHCEKLDLQQNQVHGYRNITLYDEEKASKKNSSNGKRYGENTLKSHLSKQLQRGFPILLTGESGSEIHSVAGDLVYEMNNANPVYLINGFGLAPTDLDFLLDEASSPFYEENISMVISHLEALNDSDFFRLIEGLVPLATVPNHILVLSFEVGLMDVYKEKQRIYLIKNKLNAIEENITPLRERMEEIANYVVYNIQKLNQELNTEIIGIEPEAMSILQAHPWPRNWTELDSVLAAAMKLSKSPWITSRNIRSCIEPQKNTMPQEYCRYDKPFEEIKKDIFRQVYREENYNQKKAAERLGISRTTLWRVLKDAN